MKAFLVDCEQENGAQIYFAETANQAKCYAANEEGIEYIEVTSCRRRPQFDQYAPGPIPPKVLIEDGWWFECHGCNRRVEEDMHDYWEDDGPTQPDGPVYRGQGVWCSTNCQAKSDAREAEARRKSEETIAAVRSQWPGVGKVVPYMRGDGKECAWFEFGGTYHATWVVGEDTVHVAGQDVAAWKAFRDTAPPATGMEREGR
jgi:hypothetical protein